MTRFARAQGSKSSNKLVPEDSSNKTPEEISAKVEPKNFVSNKKTKYKKKALQIPSPKINNKGDNTDKIKKSNKSTQKESNNEIENGVNNNDEPEEESAKVPGQFLLIKKTKNKKKNSLKNKLINNEENVDGLNKTLPAQDSKKKNREKNKNLDKSISNKESSTDKGEKKKLNRGQKRKQRDENKEHKRRKPMQPAETIKMKGVEEQIVYYQNFPICKSDHDNLVALRKTLISKGVPKSEVDRTMKLERRKAEKRLSRAKKVVCFQCREVGHLLSECPMLENKSSSLIETSGTGICFKCGSTEHSARECKVSEGFKFAKCFICREQGHIASQCPDNPRGLYPKGGACKSCGSVEHFKKDCPKFLKKQYNDLFLKTISNGNLESIDDTAEVKNVGNKDKKKVVKF